MDFAHVDSETNERYARLYPLVAENQKLKEAAKDAPDMLKFSRKDDIPHYRLYENRIPAGMDADKAFGAYASDEARTASEKEFNNYRAGKKVVQEQQRANTDKSYPEEIRYYPAVGGAEGKNRDAYTKIVAEVAKAHDKKPSEIIQYNNLEGVKAFVSKIGPIPELAYFQTEEAKAAWAKDGEKLSKQQEKSVSRAKDVVDRASLQAEGKDFMGKYGKGLMLPSTKLENERAAVEADIRGASTKDLQAVRQATEVEFKALEKKLYGIEINAAQRKNPDLTTEQFNDMNSDQRREAAGYVGLSKADFKKLVAFKNGFFKVSDELKDRGEHLSVQQARDLKSKSEVTEKAKPVDEKGVSQKAGGDDKAKEAEAPKGRASSRGAAAAAALASGLGR